MSEQIVKALNDLEPISNHVLFQFIEESGHGENRLFKSKTDWGFDLGSSHKDTTKEPRWVKIIGLGPEVPDEFHVDQVVLIEPLRWTRQVEYKGVQFARTDPNQILAFDADT